MRGTAILGGCLPPEALLTAGSSHLHSGPGTTLSPRWPAATLSPQPGPHQMSTFSDTGSLRITSGAIQATVPAKDILVLCHQLLGSAKIGDLHHIVVGD